MPPALQCVKCPSGSYAESAGNNASSAVAASCVAKTLPASCPAGEKLALGSSATADDNECVQCEVGAYSGEASLATTCSAKNISVCAAGQYFFTAGLATVDDNACFPCPRGTYSATVSALDTCKPKHPVHCAGVADYVHHGTSTTTNDNMCVPDGMCAPGFRNSAVPGGTRSCTACPYGTFKATVSAGRNCANKGQGACPAGQHRVVGVSTTMNDAMCEPCGWGTYNDGFGETSRCVFKLKWQETCAPGFRAAAYKSTTADDSACVPCGHGEFSGKTTVGVVTCTRKTLPLSCNAGQYLAKGDSDTEDDWKCTECSSANVAKVAAFGGASIAGQVSVSASAVQGESVYAYDLTDLDPVLVTGEWTTYGTAAQATPVQGVVYLEDLDDGAVSVSFSLENLPQGTQGMLRVENGTACNDLASAGWYDAAEADEDPWTGDGAKFGLGPTSPEDSAYGTFDLFTGYGYEENIGRVVVVYGDDGNGGNTAIACSVLEDSPGLISIHDGTSCPAADAAPLDGPSVPISFEETVAKGTFVVPDGHGFDQYATAGKVVVIHPNNGGDRALGCGVLLPTFTAEPNTRGWCTRKTPASTCAADEVLKLSGSSTEDDTCVRRGWCRSGQQVAANGYDCAACARGTYNPKSTTEKNACVNKTRPVVCPAGTKLVLGESMERDDWRCSKCDVTKGEHQPEPFHVLWTANLTPYTVPGYTLDCVMKVAKDCSGDPSLTLAKGRSIYVDDWVCAPSALVNVLCGRDYSEDTRSQLNMIRVGMPELVAPFVKTYTASVKLPGYSSVKKKVAVVVTGTRFISDKEKVPFPQARPLLVIHDPPGGSSFSAFKNEELQLTFIDSDTEEIMESTVKKNGGLNFNVEQEMDTPSPVVGSPVVQVKTDLPKAYKITTDDKNMALWEQINMLGFDAENEDCLVEHAGTALARSMQDMDDPIWEEQAAINAGEGKGGYADAAEEFLASYEWAHGDSWFPPLRAGVEGATDTDAAGSYINNRNSQVRTASAKVVGNYASVLDSASSGAKKASAAAGEYAADYFAKRAAKKAQAAAADAAYRGLSKTSTAAFKRFIAAHKKPPPGFRDQLVSAAKKGYSKAGNVKKAVVNKAGSFLSGAKKAVAKGAKFASNAPAMARKAVSRVAAKRAKTAAAQAGAKKLGYFTRAKGAVKGGFASAKGAAKGGFASAKKAVFGSAAKGGEGQKER